MDAVSNNGWRSWRFWALVIGTILVGVAAITRQSLWMDEGSSAFKALMPTLDSWWAMTRRLGGSDIQMPVYMFLLWCWTQLGALSEFALRAINLPWLLLGALALRQVRFWPLVYLTSPFVLYYVGELRPYAMQIAAGALAAAAFRRILLGDEEKPFQGLHELAFAAFLLICSSLTAAVWAAGLGVGLLVLRPAWLRRKGFWFRVLPWGCLALLFGGYYLFTLLEGYRATGFAGAGLLSVGFGFYELIGLLGLGPGKDELRSGMGELVPFLVILIPGFLCIAGAWVVGVSKWVKEVPRREVVGIAVAIGFPIVVLSAVGLLQDFRVLGRHFSPMIPAVLLPIAVALDHVGPGRRKAVLVGALAVVMMLVSALGLRFQERHARDDYRRATEYLFTRVGQGKTIMWNADMNAARYYAYRKGGMQMVHAIQVLESDKPSSLFMADIVFLNRPELRFQGKDHAKLLEQNSFKLIESFTGFEIWELEY